MDWVKQIQIFKYQEKLFVGWTQNVNLKGLKRPCTRIDIKIDISYQQHKSKHMGSDACWNWLSSPDLVKD